MANYVMVFKGGGTPETEEQQKAVLAAWGVWYDSIGDRLVDGGNPFGPSAGVATEGTVSEGAPSGLTGYTIVKAESLGEATEMAKAARS